MGKIKETSFKMKNGKTILMRTVQEGDAQAYLELSKAIMAENIYSITGEEELIISLEKQSAWLKDHIDNENKLNIVAEFDGMLVGQLDFVSAEIKRISHTGEFGMGIHKDFRGQGIGSLLLQTLIDWANAHPILEKINLMVHQTNDRAIAIYEKHGFKIEGIRRREIKYSADHYVDAVLMGRQL